MDWIYVKNFPPDISRKDIDDFFNPFGKVVCIGVNLRSSPVEAYVQFDNARNALNAVEYRHGYDYEGYTLQVRLKEKQRSPLPPLPPMFNPFEQQTKDCRLENNFVNFSNSSFQSGNDYNFDRNNCFMQQNCDNMSNNIERISFASSERLNSSRQYLNDHGNNVNMGCVNYSNTPERSTSCSNISEQQATTFMECSINGSLNSNLDFSSNSSERNAYEKNTENFDEYVARCKSSGIVVNYKRGLSGAGRKWFNRFVKSGFAPEEARAKALEHKSANGNEALDVYSSPDNKDSRNFELPGPSFKSVEQTSKSSGYKDDEFEAYRKDLEYLNMHQKMKLTCISKKIRNDLRKRIIRMNNYEKSHHIRVTKNKFTFLILNKYLLKGSELPPKTRKMSKRRLRRQLKRQEKRMKLLVAKEKKCAQ